MGRLATILLVFATVASLFGQGRADSVGFQSPLSADTLKHRLGSASLVKIDRIIIIGNTRTREQIILRELSLKSGDTLQALDLPVIIDLDRKKIINTRLFTKVEIKILQSGPTRVDILIDVAERWYTFPVPVFELADRNFNDWWQNYNHDLRRVNYGLRLYQYNMRGRNETLRLLAQFGFQRRFELVYRFPYIDKKQKQGLSIDVGYVTLKNAAYRTFDHRYEFLRADQTLRTDSYGGFTYSYRKSFYRTHSLKAEYRKISVSDTVRALNPEYLFGDERRSIDFTYVTYQFNADHRDFIAYPLKGYQFQANITKTGIAASDDVNKLEISALYSQHIALNRNYYFSNNTLVFWSTPEQLPYVNYSALGLRRQFVRGYELYVIEGSQYFMNKTTLKKLIFNKEYKWDNMPLDQFRNIPVALYAKTYIDVGRVRNYPAYVLSDVNTRLANTWLLGVGAGLDVVTFYDVVLRFEYTVNLQSEAGFFFHVRKEF